MDPVGFHDDSALMLALSFLHCSNSSESIVWDKIKPPTKELLVPYAELEDVPSGEFFVMHAEHKCPMHKVLGTLSCLIGLSGYLVGKRCTVSTGLSRHLLVLEG
jgi:hypothetical protein